MAKVLKDSKKLTLEDTFKLELSYAEALIICATLGKSTSSEIREKLEDSTYVNISSEYILPWNSGIDDNLYYKLKNHLKSEGFIE